VRDIAILDERPRAVEAIEVAFEQAKEYEVRLRVDSAASSAPSCESRRRRARGCGAPKSSAGKIDVGLPQRQYFAAPNAGSKGQLDGNLQLGSPRRSDETSEPVCINGVHLASVWLRWFDPICGIVSAANSSGSHRCADFNVSRLCAILRGDNTPSFLSSRGAAAHDATRASTCSGFNFDRRCSPSAGRTWSFTIAA
jgi:hypothetical protein